MDFPDFHIGYVFIGVSCIRIPTIGVCGSKVNDHTSLAVYAYCSCIRINDVLIYLAVKVSCIGIILAAQVAVCCSYPSALLSLIHCNDLLSLAAVTLCINVKLYLLGSRSPNSEVCAAVNDCGTQIVACVGELILKLLA